jgi:predicted house-cleaning noncanonical NTP pyrophosphatase (MazG superfamily)
MIRFAPYNRELVVFERWRIPYAPNYGWRYWWQDIRGRPPSQPERGTMKLVRTGIPDFVAAKGERESFRQVVNRDEHDRLLDAKFDEELREWRETFNLEELADLLGVVWDTAIRHGVGWEALLEMERAKRERFGDFLGGVVWLGGGSDE